jgi:uncharacterized protein (TIGR02145 family)
MKSLFQFLILIFIFVTVNSTLNGQVTYSCPVDINNDGIINGTDYLELLGKIFSSCPAHCSEDVNNDGIVNGSDYLQLLGKIFTTCPITDIDGNVYNTVSIGTQLWMKENLKTTKYADGTAIPLVTDNTAWGNLTTPGYCWYNNDEITYKNTYGALYNWYTINAGSLCPDGWSVPSDYDWRLLANYLITNGFNFDGSITGDYNTNNKIAKSLASTTEWNSDTTPGSVGNTDYPAKRNATGFNAYPNGWRSYGGSIYNGNLAAWWTSTYYNTTFAGSAGFLWMQVELSVNPNNVQNGFAVRCLRNISAQELPSIGTFTVTSISDTSAISGGFITSDGGGTITSHGVCWNTSGVPTTLNYKTNDGTGMSSYQSNITRLTPGITYYVRAYATNSLGTVYGNEIAFTTLQPLFSASTSAATSVTTTTATLNGTVNANNSSATITFQYGLTTSYGTEVASDHNPVTGNTNTAVSKSISGLSNATTYHYRVKAVSSKGTTYGNDMTFTTTVTVNDIDGNVYNTVKIGTQVWMKENLKTTHYKDGTSIPLVTDNTEWGSLTTPAYCWYNNDGVSYKNIYGALYNWYTTITGKICPAGWRVPNKADWQTLINYLGGDSLAGGKLKETGLIHWNSPNGGATNESGFTSLPGGYRGITNTFGALGDGSLYWSGSESYSHRAISVMNNFEDSEINVDSIFYIQRDGFSIRCLQGPEIPILTATSVTPLTSTNASCSYTVASDGGSNVTSRGVCWSTSPKPTITSNKTTDGTGIGPFTSSISGLTAITTYYVRAYATNSVGTGYGNEILFTTSADPSTPKDIDGNVYNTVTIGTQTWMKENLKTTKYNDSTLIPLVTDNTSWPSRTTPAYCWYNNDEATYKNPYGALYNWYTVNTGKLCPIGWHVPSVVEWTILENYLIANGYNYDGTISGNKIAKSLASTDGWKLSLNAGAVGNSDYAGKRNSTGFTALSCGVVDYTGHFSSVGDVAYWYSSTQKGSNEAWHVWIKYDLNYLITNDFGYGMNLGLSVRCLKN